MPIFRLPGQIKADMSFAPALAEFCRKMIYFGLRVKSGNESGKMMI